MERWYPYLLRLSDPRAPDAPVEPLEAMLLPKVWGKRKARTMRHMGRQAQMMATFSSMMVHRVEAMSTRQPVRRHKFLKKRKGRQVFSQVVSWLVVEKLRVVARMMDVTVTLPIVSYIYIYIYMLEAEQGIFFQDETHKPPRAKTIIKALFWPRGSLLAQMGCIGSSKIKTSVAIE